VARVVVGAVVENRFTVGVVLGSLLSRIVVDVICRRGKEEGRRQLQSKLEKESGEQG
jgi:hypothetical protein